MNSLFFSCFRLCIVLCISVLLCAAPASADVRDDAETAVSALNQRGAAQKLPDDMKSLNLVFDVAERYYSNNDLENAEKFYLMALQKSRIIELMLAAAKESDALTPVEQRPAASETSENAQAGNEQGAETAEEPKSGLLVGSRGVYTVGKGDTIGLVAAKLGVSRQHLRSSNGLNSKSVLKTGQKLAYNNRKIIPKKVRDGIVVNIPDRTLYYFQQGALVTSLPVALGSATKNEKYVWQTPVGKFKITAKMKDPTWTVPPSIQTEMEEQGKEVIATVQPGPENPLGKYAIKTSIPGILIHSTIRPASIYSFSSHGCIRLAPDQMEEFFPLVKVNTRGEIIYKPVKLAVTENGRVFLEVHQDVYNKSAGIESEARQMVENRNLAGMIDWEKFKKAVRQRRGIAEDISL